MESMDPIKREEMIEKGWKPRTMPGFNGLIGPIWTRQEETGWAYGLLATADHLNPSGIVHGGLLMTLADYMLSALAWEALGRRQCVTVQLDTQFIAGAQTGQFLEARGRIVRTTASLVFTQGHIVVDGSEVITANAIIKAVGRAAQ